MLAYLLIPLAIIAFIQIAIRPSIEKNEESGEIFLFYYTIFSNFTERKWIRLWHPN
jgi:hypothetical protein